MRCGLKLYVFDEFVSNLNTSLKHLTWVQGINASFQKEEVAWQTNQNCELSTLAAKNNIILWVSHFDNSIEKYVPIPLGYYLFFFSEE